MPLELQPADFTDGDELALVSALANVDCEFLNASHPGRTFDEALAGNKERWPAVYGFEAWYTAKVVDTETGKAVAVSRWMMPPDYRKLLPAVTGVPDGMELPPRKPPTTLDRDFLGRYGDLMDPIEQRELGERPSLFVDLMGTLPEYRGQGAASLMLKWATEFADEHGMISHFNDVGEGPAPTLYSKFGYKKKDCFEIARGDGKVITARLFVREPKCGSS